MLLEYTLAEWRPCIENPNYAVSSDGRVMRVLPAKGARPGKILSAKRMHKRGGYPHVHIFSDCKELTIAVHLLVASAFLGPKPTPGHQVAHADGDPTNNDISNLRWATRKENMADKKLHGTQPYGEKHPMAKRSWTDIERIRDVARCGADRKEIAKYFGIHRSTVDSIIRRAIWNAAA